MNAFKKKSKKKNRKNRRPCPVKLQRAANLGPRKQVVKAEPIMDNARMSLRGSGSRLVQDRFELTTF